MYLTDVLIWMSGLSLLLQMEPGVRYVVYLFTDQYYPIIYETDLYYLRAT